MVVFHNQVNNRKIMMMNEEDLEEVVAKRSKSSLENIIL